MKRLLPFLLLCTPSCLLSGPESPGRPDLPPDFGLRLAFGENSPKARRTELAILETGQGRWELFVRRSSGAGEWPRLWSQTYREKLADEAIAGLAKEIQATGFFDLAPQYLDNSVDRQDPLTLEISQWGRRHLVMACRRRPDRLLQTLKALDEFVPVRLGPWPEWIRPVDRSTGLDPGLVRDLEGSRALHRYWLSIEPDRTPLHLDLFALEVALGNPSAARVEVEAIARDKTLRGLVPELEAQLR